jgi:hypothetical protein
MLRTTNVYSWLVSPVRVTVMRSVPPAVLPPYALTTTAWSIAKDVICTVVVADALMAFAAWPSLTNH